jgi:hypothetical protein
LDLIATLTDYFVSFVIPRSWKEGTVSASKNAIEFIFASDGVKQDLRRTFDLASNKMDL